MIKFEVFILYLFFLTAHCLVFLSSLWLTATCIPPITPRWIWSQLVANFQLHNVFTAPSDLKKLPTSRPIHTQHQQTRLGLEKVDTPYTKSACSPRGRYGPPLSFAQTNRRLDIRVSLNLAWCSTHLGFTSREMSASVSDSLCWRPNTSCSHTICIHCRYCCCCCCCRLWTT